MKSRPFAIDPWLPFLAVFVLMYMVIPLLMMWIGLNQGYDLAAVTTVSRVTMYSLAFASVVVFLVFVAFRGTAIHHAARSGQVRHLEQMIEKGRPIDTRTLLKRTPLHFACKADRRATVIFLLEHGADPQARDLFGYTPRDFAKMESVIEFIDEFQYEKQKEPRRVAITAASTLARGHQTHDETSGLSYEQFSRACSRYFRRGFVAFGLAFATLYFSINAIREHRYFIKHDIAQKYGETVADAIPALSPFPAVVVMITGLWWIDRREKKSGEIFCEKCKKSMVCQRHLVFNSKRCPHCGHRVLAE